MSAGASWGGPLYRPPATSALSLNFGPATVISEAENERKEDSHNPWWIDLLQTGIAGTIGILNTLKGKLPSGEPSGASKQPKYGAATGEDPASGGARAKPGENKALLWVALGVGILGAGAGIYAALKR